MKLKRKQTGMVVYIKDGKPQIQTVFQDVLEDSLFNKIIKDGWFYYYLISTFVFSFSLYEASKKIDIIIDTVLVVVYIGLMARFLYKKIMS